MASEIPSFCPKTVSPCCTLTQDPKEGLLFYLSSGTPVEKAVKVGIETPEILQKILFFQMAANATNERRLECALNVHLGRLFKQMGYEKNDKRFFEQALQKYKNAAQLETTDYKKAQRHFSVATMLLTTDRVEEALTHLNTAEKMASDHPYLLAKILFTQAKTLDERTDLTESEEDRELAIKKYEQIISKEGITPFLKVNALTNLGGAMVTKHLKSKDLPTLEKGIAYFQETQNYAMDTTIESPNSYHLGQAYFLHYKASGDPKKLDLAIDLLTKTFEKSNRDADDLAFVGFQCADALIRRFDLAKAPEDVKFAATYLTRSLKLPMTDEVFKKDCDDRLREIIKNYFPQIK